jgi:hypothetical protein
MGFFDKFIPKEITKPFTKVARKVIPKELRPALPFLAAATPFLLPTTGIFASNIARALASGAANIASQKVLDPEGELNDLSILLAAGSGALSGPKTADNLRSGMNLPETTAREAGIMRASGIPAGDITGVGKTGFFAGAENLGREGLATLSDYITGSQETLANLGADPGSLFTKAGAKAAAKAAAPIVSQGTGDLAFAEGSRALREFNAAQAEELRQAGMDEAAIANARRAAIREAMEVSGFTEEDILETFDEIGLKQGGIVSLAEGGMLDFGGKEMDLRGGGFVPIGKKEKADDVPARLSKNEFVMTADAVRAAGGGSVNKGAQRMYDLMNNLEARA